MGKTLSEIIHDIAEKDEIIRIERERRERQRKNKLLNKESYGF